MPDTIAAYDVDGATYLVTANEGDARDYDGYGEEARLATWRSTPRSSLMPPTCSERRIWAACGQHGQHGHQRRRAGRPHRRLWRASFSIWDAAGNLVFDSGDAIERITAELLAEGFNSSGQNDTFDERSDDKGPDPRRWRSLNSTGAPMPLSGWSASAASWSGTSAIRGRSS